MILKELKEKILNKSISDDMIIFLDPTKFIAKQYIKEISKIKNKKIEYVDELVPIQSDSLFGDIEDNSIKVLMTEVFDNDVVLKNSYVICDKISDIVNKDYIIEVPKLENWQIQDYVYTKCKGADKADLDKLLALTNYDINRLENEINKITLFTEKSRKSIVKQFFEDSIFSDLSEYTIFSLSNALITKDINQLKSIIEEIDNIDINPIGFTTVLYNNFKNIINIQLGINVTADSLKMNPKQFAALRYRINHYSRNQLISIFEILTEIDYQLKSGYLPADMIIDYLILKILSVDNKIEIRRNII